LDKVQELLVDALKQALAEPEPQRLYKSGKLVGLFSARNGIPGDAAVLAVREGLLEVVRTETKGKTAVEWVRVTPKGIEFIHAFESPVAALKELSAVLQANRDAIPFWLTEIKNRLNDLGTAVSAEAQRWSHRLDSLSQRVEEALKRVDGGPSLPDDALADAPWAPQVLTYLRHRKFSGVSGECTFPELYQVARDQSPDLSLIAFHDRLRRLQDRKLLQLHPFNGQPQDITQPEFALVEGSRLLYYATLPSA
jgi:hypothetical protein